MNEDELFRRVVRVFLEKHGDEVRRAVKGDLLLEAGLKRLEEIAGITHHGSPKVSFSGALQARAAHPPKPLPTTSVGAGGTPHADFAVRGFSPSGAHSFFCQEVSEH